MYELKRLNNVELKKYTTIKIGGIAENFYIPESVEELQMLMEELKNETIYLLAGGSNLLINDEKIFKHVICLLEFNQSLEIREDRTVYAGGSVRLQKFINILNQNGLGGIEYLYSVPGTVGGAIVMNAGRGKKYNQCISDYIIAVDVLENGKILTYKKEECQFSYRNSRFKNQKGIVVGVHFQFKEDSVENLKRAKEARIAFSRERQDHSGSNFGSVFCESSPKAMNLIKLIGLGNVGDVRFSKKTANWILNRGNAKFSDVMKMIERAKKVNRLFRKDAKLEVIIWN